MMNIPLGTRARGCRRKLKETRYLITSTSNERLGARGLLNAKRGFWAIVSARTTGSTVRSMKTRAGFAVEVPRTSSAGVGDSSWSARGRGCAPREGSIKIAA
jgi:hypothetical protein